MKCFLCKLAVDGSRGFVVGHAAAPEISYAAFKQCMHVCAPDSMVLGKLYVWITRSSAEGHGGRRGQRWVIEHFWLLGSSQLLL